MSTQIHVGLRRGPGTLYRLLFMALAVGLPLRGVAAEARAMLGPGATKEDVVATYGWPNGQSKAGAREILTYPQGQITLENGRVEKIDFGLKAPWPAPRPRPGPPTASTAKKDPPPVDTWLSTFEAAAQEAGNRNARLLALFTGSDWSPPSRQFLDEVAFHPDFLNAFRADFVFLRLDYPTRAPQSNEQREHNARLRAWYGVTLYPTLLVLSSAGEPLGRVDLTKSPADAGHRESVIAAVREVQTLLAAAPSPATPAESKPAAAPRASEPSTATAVVASSMARAQWLLFLGLGGGLLITAVLWWLLWRRWSAPARPAPAPIAERIADAANGLPTYEQMAAWPRARIRGVTAALAEANRYAVEVRPAGADTDLLLTRRGESIPVLCAEASSGPISGKRVRELSEGLNADSGGAAWIVAPSGFTSDAYACAQQASLVLVDAERLLTQLRDLPPLVLPKVLSRVA